MLVASAEESAVALEQPQRELGHTTAAPTRSLVTPWDAPPPRALEAPAPVLGEVVGAGRAGAVEESGWIQK